MLPMLSGGMQDKFLMQSDLADIIENTKLVTVTLHISEDKNYAHMKFSLK